MGAVNFSIDPALVRELKRNLSLEVFVETGTFKGDSVVLIERHFQELHTIELSEELYEAAAEKFERAPEITVHHGDSSTVLSELVPTLNGRPTLYWLDAHWCASDVSSTEIQPGSPLLAELDAIGELGDESAMLIDDARLYLSPPPGSEGGDWPTTGEVLSRLEAIGAEHELMVIDDVVVVFPVAIRDELRTYSREHAVDWLVELETGRATTTRLDALEAGQQRAEEQRIRQVQALSEQLVRITDQVESLQHHVGGLRADFDLSRKAGSGLDDIPPLVGELRNKFDTELEAQTFTIEALQLDITDLSAVVEGHSGQTELLRAELRMLAVNVDKALQPSPARRAVWAVRGFGLKVRDFVRFGLRDARHRTLRALRITRMHARGIARRALPDPRLGNLNQHAPIEVRLPARYRRTPVPDGGPMVSIATPSYNQADFLERTMKSVLDQEYPDLEYTVQDGGSADGSKELLERYSDRLHSWESRRDEGQANAVNLALSRTTGEILAYLNSDDILLPGSIAYVARYFERHPKVDAVYGHRILIDANDREIGRWILPRHTGQALVWADYVPQETLFWRRRIWDATGSNMDESFQYALDWDLLLRFQDAGAKIVRVPRFLGAFRVHAEQKTTADVAAAGFDEMARLRVRVHDRELTHGEIARGLRGYMRRHVALDRLYRARLLRY